MSIRNTRPWTIVPDFARPDAEVVARLGRIETGQLADASPQVRVLPGLLRLTGDPFDGGICGPALTVWTNPGDLLFPLKSADCVHPGDVVVMDGAGWTGSALVGEIYAGAIAANRAAGAVVDGAIRDLEGIQGVGMSFWARAGAPGKQTMAGPGAIGVDITPGGVPISPGDIIRADATGVVVVPAADAEAVLDAAHRVDETEAGWKEAIAARGIGAGLGLDALIEQGRR